MWRSSCSRLRGAVPQARPNLSMLSDSSICHLRDTAYLWTGNAYVRRRRGPKRPGNIQPSSPLFRVFVQLADGSREHAVFACTLFGGLGVKPARVDVARRDGEARRDLLFADVHRVWATRMKAASARGSAQAGRRSAVGDLWCLRAIRIRSRGEQELRVRVGGVIGQGDARRRLDELPGIHDDDRVGEVARGGDVVGDVEDREVIAVAQVGEQVEHGETDRYVEH